MHLFRRRQNRAKKSGLRLLVAAIALLLSLAAIAWFSVWAYLGSAAAPQRISQLLSDVLGQPVVIEHVGLSGATLTAGTIRIANAGGFHHGELAVVQSLAVTPDWPGLLVGRRALRSLEINGLRLRLVKGDTGEWNFAPLARRFGGQKKGSPSEFSIGRLHLVNSAVTVNDVTLQRLALTLKNFSTRATGSSGLLISFSDSDGNPCRLQGTVRLGAEPAFTIALSAPTFSLADLPQLNATVNLHAATASLQVTAALQRGELTSDFKLGLRNGQALIKGSTIPLQGELSGRAVYSTRADSGRLENGHLHVNNLVSLSASGTLSHARTVRTFSANVAGDTIDLQRVGLLLPAGLLQGLAPAGQLQLLSLQLTGDRAHGLTGGKGVLQLRQCALAKGGTDYFKALSSTLTLLHNDHGWGINGQLSLAESGTVPLLQNLKARISGQLSPFLRPVALAIPYQATFMAAPLHGRISLNPAAALPYLAEMELPSTPLNRFNRLLAGRNLHISAGSAALSLQITGSSPQALHGSLTSDLHNLQGHQAERTFALKHGSIKTDLSLGRNGLAAAGRASLVGGVVNKQELNADFDYRLANGRLTLTRAHGSLGGTTFSSAEMSAALPRTQTISTGSSTPLDIAVRDLQLHHREGALDGINATITGRYLTSESGRRLEGDAALTVASLRYRGEGLGNLTAAWTLAGNGVTARYNGTLLGGSIAGSGRFEPFKADPTSSFSLTATAVSAPRLLRLTGRNSPLTLSSGLLAIDLNGDYRRQTGWHGRVRASGSDLSMTKAGRSLVSGAATRLSGELSGDRFTLTTGQISVAETAVKVTGQLNHPYAAGREGQFTFAMPPTALPELLGTFSSSLPHSLQGVVSAGQLSLNGSTRISGGTFFVDGQAMLQEGRLELPGQKLILADINGSLPFSLDLAGTAATPPLEGVRFNHDNFALAVRKLHERGTETGQRLTIGSTRFGSLELARTTIVSRAAKGLTELVAFDSGLYGGRLRGKGFFRYRHGAEYGADVAVESVSIRELCAAIPAIRGYMTGRVYGTISLFKESSSDKAAAGFAQLWVQSQKDEKMLVSKEFLQKLAGKKLKGLFFRSDQPYDRGEITAFLEDGYLTFDTLDISHTSIFGIKDLNVSVVAAQNRIALEHLLDSIRNASARQAGPKSPEPPPQADFKWLE